MLRRRRHAFLIITRDVAAREDGVFKLFERRIQLPDAVLEILQILEQDPVRLDEGRDLVRTSVVSHELVMRRDVDTVDVGVADLG